MKYPLLLVIAFSLMSFTNTKASAINQITELNLLKGNYGSALVNLTINEDQTFSYSDKTTQLTVSGTWIYTKGKIILTSESDVKFHDKWTVSKDSKSIKSRKGLAFYRLCMRE
ncbi:MAG: hypothetical protein KJP21_08005 [Bacteroidia bacterium]|nr:hypothetical protein [Bacteroidia bacterium]NNJ56303.1 hypothetical protein [Bacteroidia bacterium]